MPPCPDPEEALKATRRIRLFAATALIGFAAGLSPAAAGGADAASIANAALARPAAFHPGVSMWSKPWRYFSQKIRATCPSVKDLSTPGAEYRVNAVGVHLRRTPGGKVESGIGRGKLFASDWFVGRVGVYQCTASAVGKTWRLGVSQAGQAGWVRTDYLTFVRYLHR